VLRFYRKLVALRALRSKSTRRWLPERELSEARASSSKKRGASGNGGLPFLTAGGMMHALLMILGRCARRRGRSVAIRRQQEP
jgi:hypothetical protein